MVIFKEAKINESSDKDHEQMVKAEDMFWKMFKPTAEGNINELHLLIGHFIDRVSVDIQKLYKSGSVIITQPELLRLQRMARELMITGQKLRSLD